MRGYVPPHEFVHRFFFYFLLAYFLLTFEIFLLSILVIRHTPLGLSFMYLFFSQRGTLKRDSLFDGRPCSGFLVNKCVGSQKNVFACVTVVL